MTSSNKTLENTPQRSRIFTPKVNIRQYLANKREPAETITDITPVNLDQESGIIKDASPGRKALRRLAMTLRFGYKI